MFKKIEIWILYLIVLFGIPISISFGVLVRQGIEGVTKRGNFDISFLTKPAVYIARIPEELIITLLKSEVHRINHPWSENRYFYTQNGFNGTPNSNESYLLLSRYDGDLKEGIVELVDLTNFKVLHTWNPDIDELNELVEKYDIWKNLDRDFNDSRALLKHPKLTKDGGLVFNTKLLRKIDQCSNLIFQTDLDISHHSVNTDVEGNIWIPTYIFPQSLPEEIVGRDLLEDGGTSEDGILKYSSSGEILFRKSLSQIFIDNNLENYLFGYGSHYMKDPLHLNDIQPVDYDGDYWKKGDVFLSLRNQSMIVLYRPSTNQIVWKTQGPFFNQHDVDILDDHRISIFDNRMQKLHNNRIKVDGNNQVIIYNFKTGKYTSYLKNSLIKNDVRTKNQGLNEILPNGDLFVEESNYARTLYFNSDGSLRWTHVNRANNGNLYHVGWSRILHNNKDIKIVKNFLNSQGKCND